MNPDKLAYLNALFSAVRSCAEHGSLNRISGAIMEEIKAFDENPDLLKDDADVQPNP